MADGKNPSFRNAPVVETVLGVQFDPVKGLSNAHLGAFWAKAVPDWLHTSDAAPLPPVFEQFDDEQPWLSSQGLGLMITRGSPTRVRIKNETKDRMIQVQNGRFHYNWLGVGGGVYPRYTEVRPDFDKTFEQFCSFVSDLGLEEVTPNQWEVTYVNHIPKGTVWDSPRDWSTVFPTLLAKHAEVSVGSLERLEAEWHFEIAPKRGRLHVSLRSAQRATRDRTGVLVLNLTARGPVESDGMSLHKGLDVGRAAIVNAFAEITSPSAHEFWERES